jgi:hypothetical protein
MQKILLLSLVASAILCASSETEMLKAQIAIQQKSLEALQAQVAKIELQNEKKKQDEIKTKIAQSKNDFSSSFSQNAYLPEMAFILNMSAAARNINNDSYSNLAIPGFIDAGDADLPFNANRGFNFNYAEVALHSTVDPYFDAFVIFHISPDELEIEEAYVTTRALDYGLKAKMGKFKSAFGRINEKHQHSWNFDEQPIIYKSLFGPDGISDPGLQVQWVAPIDTYLMVGVDAMQGTNERSFGDTDENNLYVGYLKSSLDIGDDLSILGGLSLAHGQTDTHKDSDVYGADLTLREQLGSYSSLVWQSEYLYRNKKTDTSSEKQAGLYSELVYQYNNNYSAGFMYDVITKNDTDLSLYNGIDTNNLDRYTAMIEYKPFPMSRFRLEASYDRTKVIDGARKDVKTIMMTLNIAAGAHGAHSY